MNYYSCDVCSAQCTFEAMQMCQMQHVDCPVLRKLASGEIVDRRRTDADPTFRACLPMPLNCKPGDLAMVIKGRTNAGKMVQCKQIYPILSVRSSLTNLHIGRTMGSVWEIDRTITWIEATTKKEFELPICPDSWLMPIRPEPEEDTVNDTEELKQT